MRRPWQDIGANISTDLKEVNNELNKYYNVFAFAHAISVQATGQAPFTLPDQIYGFTTSGGGQSDRISNGGSAMVSSGFSGSSREATMAHEFNHNLDRTVHQTWGRHVTDLDGTNNKKWGCDAPLRGDPDWPRSNDEIAEIGFDTRLPWNVSGSTPITVVPDKYPDFMSYCKSDAESGITNQRPTKWISDYRWPILSALFAPAEPGLLAANLAVPAPVYYISGELHVGGTGSLSPVKTQPGIVSDPIAPGDYALEIQDAGGQILLSVPFIASFTNEEGEAVDTEYFHYRLPVQPDGAKVVLKHSNDVLDTIVASANPPTAQISAPSGGETWSGEETIQWTANDLDGDLLTFTILYTPDGGDRWYPVARDLTATEYTVEAGRLPGGAGGRVMIIVTDGFHTVTAESAGAFSVPDPMPIVVIDSPADGFNFMPGDWINLSGSASLPSGPGDDLTFIWSVDGEVVDFGSRAKILLEEGIYSITLDVYDDEGTQGTASVIVTVKHNDPPNKPVFPFPGDGVKGVFVKSIPSWTGGDIDGDPVTYDVYLEVGNTEPAVVICDDSPISNCVPPADLLPSTQYYWQVVARDDQGETTVGDIWEFETGDQDPDKVIHVDGFE